MAATAAHLTTDPDGSRPGAADLIGTDLELDVGAVAHGGVCVARHEGRVVFVRHALPGERVRAVVTSGEATARFLRADAVTVLVASPDRVRPPCPYAGPGRCGGCDWQHASLPAQRELKAAVVAEQLRRLAGLDIDVAVQEVPGAPDGLGWRTRVGFTVRPDGVVGLRRHRSHEIEPVDRCLIAAPGVEEVGVERRRWPGVAAVDVVAGAGADRAVVVTPCDPGGTGFAPMAAPGTGFAPMAAPGTGFAPMAAPGTGFAVPPLDVPATVLEGRQRGRPRAVRGRPGVREEAAGRSWRVTGGGFWQVHPAAAQTLVETVLDFAGPREGESALDLYCGVGLFAGALAPLLGPGGRVTAIESDPVAATDARHNLRDLTTVRVEAGTVAAVPRRIGLRRADLVVLDPPRSGAGADVCRFLAGLGARAIVYVACDPAALARDLATLAGLGYRLTRLCALDLFPMTAHIECVALLEPAGARGTP